MVLLDGHSVVALDGTGYVSSQTMHGASCVHRVHRNGAITSWHPMLGAALIHPDRREVMPRMPEPMVQHDGPDNNDGERHAAKRLVATWRQAHPHLTFLVTEDSRSSHAPPSETLQDHDRHAIRGGKEGDHALLFQPVEAAEQAGGVTS